MNRNQLENAIYELRGILALGEAEEKVLQTYSEKHDVMFGETSQIIFLKLMKVYSLLMNSHFSPIQ
jgi:hypothetical protein